METFQEKVKMMGILVTADQVSKFKTYLQELLEWNEKLNLTAIREEKDIVEKHFLDSLTLLPYISKEQIALADIGSGAGFPGIPLKIMRPDISLTLVESVGKKTKFLEHIVETLLLEDVEVVNARAEDVGQNQDYREKFDVVTARAVAHLPTLLELALPLLKIGGIFLAQKETGKEEMANSQNALKELGGVFESEGKINNPLFPNKTIFIFKKEKPTPEKFPRKAGKPDKKPL